MFSASSDRAAASSRRSISIATERARVSTTSCGAQPPRLRREALEQARGRPHRLEVAGEALAHAGPHHLDGDARRRRVQAGLVDLRDRGRRDRLAEAREQLVEGPPERRLDDQRPRPRAGRAACGPAGARGRAPPRRRRCRAGSPGTGRTSRRTARAGSAPRRAGRRRRRRLAPLDEPRGPDRQRARPAAARSGRRGRARPRAPGRTRRAGCGRNGRGRRSLRSSSRNGSPRCPRSAAGG